MPSKDPLTIKKKYFEKFKKLYREEFGEEKFNEMTEQQLFESAMALVTLVEAVYKPITREEFEKFKNA